MANLLNSDRKNNGLAALALDPELCRIARIKSEDMRDNRYFAHESPTFGRVGDMLRRFGYSFRSAGENIPRSSERMKRCTQAHSAAACSTRYRCPIVKGLALATMQPTGR